MADSWYAPYKVADPLGEALGGRFIECKWPIHWVQLTKWLIHYVQPKKKQVHGVQPTKWSIHEVHITMVDDS